MGTGEIVSLLKSTKRKLTSKEIAEILHRDRNSLDVILKKLRRKRLYPFISYDIKDKERKNSVGNYVYIYWYNDG